MTVRKEPPDKRESKTPPSQEICTKCGKPLVPARKVRKIWRNPYGMRYSRQKTPKFWRLMKCSCPPERIDYYDWLLRPKQEEATPPRIINQHSKDDTKAREKAKRHRKHQSKDKR